MLLILILNKMSRQTKQKRVIGEELDKFKTFFTAEDLHEKVKAKNVSLATIYRFLNELKSKKKIYSYLCDRRQVYSNSQNSHCHFICEKTGKVIHFTVGNIDFLKNKIPGKITSFQIEVKGICDEC